MAKKKTKHINVRCYCNTCKIEFEPSSEDGRQVCPKHGTWDMVETNVLEVEVGVEVELEQLSLDI